MYAWKCWRDTRSRFILYLSLLVPLCVILAATALLWNPKTGWSLVRGSSQARIAWVGQDVVRVSLFFWGAFFTSIASFSLGASGIGEEFRRGSLEFLLTRPRRRSYFVWTGWAVGVCELLIILSLAVLATIGTLFYLTGSVYTWRFLGVILFLFPGGAVLYGLTYFMTVLLRSSRDALGYSVVLLFMHLLLTVAVRQWWQVDLPSLTDLLGSYKWIIDAAVPFPAARVAGWGLIAAAFPVAAQLIFDRAEV